MSDPASLATLDVLAKIGVPAFYTDANLLGLITCRAVNLSLERGNCDASCSAYVWLSMVAGPIFGDYRIAVYRFGQLGYDLVEKRGLTRFQPRITYMDFGGSDSALDETCPGWPRFDPTRVRGGKQDRRSSLAPLAAAAETITNAFSLRAIRSPRLEREAEHGLAFAEKARFGTVIDANEVAQLGLIRTLRGSGRRHSRLLRRSAVQRGADRAPASQTILTWPSSNAGIGFVSCRRDSSPATTPRPSRPPSRARRLLWTSISRSSRSSEYPSLCRAISRRSLQFPRRAANGARTPSLRTKSNFGSGAANCPDNFENRAALVAAEMKTRLEGRTIQKAESLYEQAIQSARANAFIHQEGARRRAKPPDSMRRAGLRTSPICICARARSLLSDLGS